MFLIKEKRKENGEATILFLLIIMSTLMIVTLTTVIIKKEIKYQVSLINKKKCLIKLNAAHVEYVQKIRDLNNLIISGNIIQLIPGATASIIPLKKIIKSSQELFYGIYIAKLIAIEKCHPIEIKNYLSSYPFKRKKRIIYTNKVRVS